MPYCQYCRQPAKMVTGEQVYPQRPELWHKAFWVCEPCDARVGTHPGTTKPLGLLVNDEGRRARMRAHRAFDRLWLDGLMTRSAAYRWLAEQLGMERRKTHIGYFTATQCERVERLATDYYHQRRSAP